MKKALLLVLALMLLVIVGCSGGKEAAAPDSPEGALNGYFQSLQDKKYEQAYSYMKTTKTKDQFVEEKKSSPMSFKGFEIKDVKVTGDKANGAVIFKTGSDQMPEVTLDAELEKEGSKWVITSLGMGGGMGGGTGGSGMPPSGMPSGMGGGMPPAGDMPPGGMPPSGMPPAGEMPPAGNGDAPAQDTVPAQ